jgi:hypothetical protein
MKTKLINIVLICFLILFSIYLLFILFNSKHNDIYNKMNEMILKEKFSTEAGAPHDCLDISTSTKCNSGSTDDIKGLDELFNKCNNANPEEKKVAMECADDNSNKDVCCDKADNIDEYCTYLNSIKRLLWGTCLTCDKKKAIIDAVKRSKCNYTQPVPPASPPQDDTPPEAGGGGGGGV